jgi:hypothetical protein
MATTEQVFIEFITNDEQLKSSEDRLAALGKTEKANADQFKAANTEINKQVQSLKNLETVNNQIGKSGNNLKKTVADLATQVKGMSGVFQKEFKAGAVEALNAAGVSAEEFEKALEAAGGQTVSLKAQLREMIQQLAQMKVEGKDNTDQYRALAQQAGQLKDAIGDANQEVKNFGSDTSTFDGLIQSVQGLAGGFAVAQGAQALFGDESEELQKTLLKVNAAMAILQGLQQIQIVLQKESAASQVLNNVALKAYNFIIGTSTGLTKAFRIALAATGVGLLVIGIYELVQAFKSSNNEMEEANRLLEEQERSLSSVNDLIQRRTDIEIARLKASDAAESAILAATGRSLVAQREALLMSNKTLAAQRDALDTTSEAWFKLNEQIENNGDAIRDIDTKLIVAQLGYTKQLADERAEAEKKRRDDAAKAAEDAKRRREEQLQKEREARAAGFADFKAGVELELLAAEQGSEEQLEIRKRLLRAELQVALDNEKLTGNQRKLLVQQFFKDRIELEKQFARDRDKVILENIASDIQAELQGLEVTQERRLELVETALRLEAQMEIDAANGNAAKIAEINAKRDKDIRDARIASIQEAVEYELRITADPAENRRLARVVQDIDAEFELRINAVDRLAAIEAGGVAKRIEALNKEKADKLISQRDYDLQYKELVDQQTKIWEDAEKQKTDISNQESQKRTEKLKEDIANVASVAQTVSDILSSINDITTQKENERIRAGRELVKEQQEAGAITEKEAIARLKRLDAEEKKVKQAQAKRDKEVALFNAIISTARGIAEAIPNPFLMALAAVVGAAQIAAIAARPIPKVGKGKKNSYSGLAEVGETGTEIVQRDGRMYVVDKPTVTYLGAKDIVFNPQETAAMLTKPVMTTERLEPVKEKKTAGIDYKKMGKEIGQHLKTHVYVDGVEKQTIEKNLFTKWLDNRRSL